MPLTNGENFAGYTIIRLLGSGGMGEVYLAQHPRLPRQDALKILRPDVSSDSSFRVCPSLPAAHDHQNPIGTHDRSRLATTTSALGGMVAQLAEVVLDVAERDLALAGLMARTDADSYILVGHSLGARAMVTAAQTLATNPNGPKITTVHLLGAAIGAKGDWRSVNDAVTDAVYNYYSANDKVLKYLYTVVQAGSIPAGLRGFGSKFPKIKDRNVSRLVKSHSDYFSRVDLV